MTDATPRTGPLAEILAEVEKMTPAEREQFLAWLLWQRTPRWRRMLVPDKGTVAMTFFRRIMAMLRRRRLRVVDGGRQPWREGPHR